jgi:hypothetical protein
MPPLLPQVAAPVLSTTIPDRPAVPAPAVMINVSPLLEALPEPLDITTLPPVPSTVADEVPALSTNTAPVPLSPVPALMYT